MRYEHVLQSECPNCHARLTKVATFCCSDVATRTCCRCGHSDHIPADDVHKRLMYELHAGASYKGEVKVWYMRPLNEAEIEEQRQWREKYVREHGAPPEFGFLKCDYHLESASGEQTAQFLSWMKECGIDQISGAQIGFLGNKQVFDRPWKFGPDAKL